MGNNILNAKISARLINIIVIPTLFTFLESMFLKNEK